MKKLTIIPAALLVCAGAAYGQGQIAYQNSVSAVNGPVLYKDASGTTAKASGAASEGIKIQLYYQLDSGGAAPAAINNSGALGNWTAAQIVNISGTAIPGSGFFTAGTLNLVGVAGNQMVWVDLVGWDSGAASLAAAIAAHDGLGFSTVGSLLASDPNGNPETPPPAISSAAGFNGLTIVVGPEPTTMALGALGAASLLAFRRKK